MINLTINNPYRVPAGTIQPWPNVAIPTGYLLCDGSAISRTTYAALFAAIGTTYGVGNGTTTFNLPNGQIPLGGNLPVISNGKCISCTDGTNLFGLATGNADGKISTHTGLYGKNTGTARTSGDNVNTSKAMGITTDKTKTGIIADLKSSNVTTKTIIKY